MGKYFIISILFFFQSCETQDKKVFKKQCYPSGKLKSCGYYVNDSIAIDTTTYFYENGNNSGYLNGVTKFYYENGVIERIMNYKEDSLQEFSYKYMQNGLPYSKIFYLDDKQVGDCYWYYSNIAKIRKYGFYDLEGHNRNLVTYDSTGNIIEDLRPIIFIDSIKTYSDSLDKKNYGSYDILLIISNPPKCRTSITIDYFSKEGVLIRRDSIVNKHYYFNRQKFSDSISNIKYVSSQYDSLKKMFFKSRGSVNIDN